MTIFDPDIFDGPPNSTIFDTIAGVPVPRTPSLARAQIHGIKGSARVTN